MTVTVALGGLFSASLSLPISRRAATASMSYGSDGGAGGCASRSWSTAARSYRSGEAAKCAAEAAGDLRETTRIRFTHCDDARSAALVCSVDSGARGSAYDVLCRHATQQQQQGTYGMFSDSIRYAVSTAEKE